MRVFIRTDSSTQIGSGHVMRCLTLADVLHDRGADVSFVCSDLPGNLSDLIERKGFRVHKLTYVETINNESDKPAYTTNRLGIDWQLDADETITILCNSLQPIHWLIVDHYALDSNWECRIRAYVKRIMVIDDLADRIHDCDLLLDQNLYKDMEARYEGLVPDHCWKLLGPEYAILRREFIEARQKLRNRDGSVKRILVFFGEIDPTNETSKALEALRILDRSDILVDVVSGVNNPHRAQIQRLCSQMPNTRFRCQVDNMAQLMSAADLALGAGGTTTWERCFLGLPSIIMVIAQNQYEVARAVANAGAAWNLGWSTRVDIEHLSREIERAISDPDAMREMSGVATSLMGHGSSNGMQLLVDTLIEGADVHA